MTPTVVTTVAEVHAFAAAQLKAGKTVALVPTMGFLHRGHTSLMREGGKRADVVAASIFVNPTQFGPKEDLSTYPRDFGGDVKQCGEAGVSLIFAPQPAEMYPPGYQTYVTVEEVSQGLDGEKRPGHFRGVATVVTRLLTMFRPTIALFGEKDFQQLQVISALNRDLNLGVKIIGMPTIRESDGLAMSSRNAYLNADERQRALALSKGLFAAQAKAKSGERDAEAIKSVVRASLNAVSAREDYVELVNATTLRSISTLDPSTPNRLLVAAFLGKTRLIDNVAI